MARERNIFGRREVIDRGLKNALLAGVIMLLVVKRRDKSSGAAGHRYPGFDIDAPSDGGGKLIPFPTK